MDNKTLVIAGIIVFVVAGGYFINDMLHANPSSSENTKPNLPPGKVNVSGIKKINSELNFNKFTCAEIRHKHRWKRP